MAFEVYRADGTKVEQGDTLTSSRNEEHTFRSCTHPRKVYTSVGERYPSVYNVEIRGTVDDEGYIWNPVSDEGRRLDGAELLNCGCPRRIVLDEGHQEGCVTRT